VSGWEVVYDDTETPLFDFELQYDLVSCYPEINDIRNFHTFELNLNCLYPLLIPNVVFVKMHFLDIFGKLT
jgi:hypothetical protein